MTGAGAFDAAKSSSRMTGSGNLSAANEAMAERMDQLVLASGLSGRDSRERSEVKRAGGRVLALRKGVWTDVAHRDSLKVTTIAPFSRAWFALIEARPALKSALAAGTPLLLAGRRVSLKVADGGTSEWAPGALDSFLKEFEGR
jgi:hypothetical protein